MGGDPTSATSGLMVAVSMATDASGAGPGSLPDGAWGAEARRASILRAPDVRAVLGLDDDARPGGDVRGHHGTGAVRELGGLVGRRCRLTFHGRFCLDDLEGDPGREIDRDRHAVVGRE